jgi:nucleotide-binding universal stress UspA family protein
MWGNRFLLAIDQFESGRAAAAFTAWLATGTSSEVMVLHVREQPANTRARPFESLAEAQTLVDEVLLDLRCAGVGTEGRVCTAPRGYVAQRIVEESARWRCSAIVLGSRRLRGLERVAGRGVRERVLRLAALPVIAAPTLVPQGLLAVPEVDRTRLG